jgi:hypothetical protein
MHEYEARFPLEIEQKAFEELKEHIRQSQGKDNKRFNFFRIVDEKIGLYILNNKITLVDTLHECSRAFEKLFRDIYKELVNTDPELHIINLFNSVAPEDLSTRKWIRSLFSDYAFDPYYANIDLLKGDGVAKMRGKLLSGVPMSAFLVGQILNNLLWDFEHYRCIDAVKETGAKESVEELRKNRIYKTAEGAVWDYSPLVKRELSKSGIIIEVFRKEDFEGAKKDKEAVAREVDRILCALIQETHRDPRENIYFGDNLNSGFKYTVRFGTEEETVPIQLLPKYRGLIKKLSRLHNFSTPEDKKREEETQTGMIGLIKGARTWTEGKGPATNWLAEYVKFELGTTFKELSTEQDKEERRQQERWNQGKEFDLDLWFQERILKEDFESLGGKLNDPIDKTDKKRGTYIDNLPDKDTPSPLTRLLNHENESEKKKALAEILRNNPKIQKILQKKERDGALTSAERVTKHRIIKELREKLLKKKN